MDGGIDGFYRQRYSLPIHSHLVARANPEFLLNRHDSVRFHPQLANNHAAIPSITPVQSSNQQPKSALEAGPWEAI
jgi:hypothetical protein